MNIKIYVAYHKEDDRIENDIYTPIQVGRDLSPVVLENMIGDNTGENISRKNRLYCETTATYWAWKNSTADYIGICHYRRFFSLSGPSLLTRLRRNIKYARYITKWVFRSKFKIAINWKNLKIVKSTDDIHKAVDHFTKNVENYLLKNKYDILALKPVTLNTSVFTSMPQASGTYHTDIIKRIITESYPEYLKTFNRYGDRNKFSPANMVVMKKEKYDEYASFLFHILEEHERILVEEGWCIDYYKEKGFLRVSGYLAEMLTAVFVKYNSKKHKNTGYIYMVSTSIKQKKATTNNQA